MTPDGISDADWDRVHELAVEIVNAPEDSDDEREHVEQLFRYLDQLEHKYGVLPSLLATRADYVKDPRESLRLLERAYGLSQDTDDARNMLYTASSIAKLYIEHFRDVQNAEAWLRAIEDALKRTGDESDILEYQQLRTSLTRIREEQP